MKRNIRISFNTDEFHMLREALQHIIEDYKGLIYADDYIELDNRLSDIEHHRLRAHHKQTT